MDGVYQVLHQSGSQHLGICLNEVFMLLLPPSSTWFLFTQKKNTPGETFVEKPTLICGKILLILVLKAFFPIPFTDCPVPRLIPYKAARRSSKG